MRIIGLAVLALLSACAKSPEATRIVNRADVALQVVYVAKAGGTAKTLHLEAGESALLGEGHRLPDYASVEFRDANMNVVFRDTDPDWRDSSCTTDCAFIWYGDGRVGITA